MLINFYYVGRSNNSKLVQLEKRIGGGGGGGGGFRAMLKQCWLRESCVIEYLLNYSRRLYTSVWRVMPVVHVEQNIVEQNIGE